MGHRLTPSTAGCFGQFFFLRWCDSSKALPSAGRQNFRNPLSPLPRCMFIQLSCLLKRQTTFSLTQIAAYLTMQGTQKAGTKFGLFYPSSFWHSMALPPAQNSSLGYNPPESGMSGSGERQRKLPLTPVYHVGIAITIIIRCLLRVYIVLCIHQLIKSSIITTEGDTLFSPLCK